MERIPTVPFDPAKHVIECRETNEGRQVFVTLESLMRAEDVIDGAAEFSGRPPAGDFATRAELAMMRDAIAKAVSERVPPPELPAEFASTLAALGQAMAHMSKQIAAMQSVVDAHTAAFEAIKARVQS